MRANKQSGMTTVSTLFLVAIVGFFLTVLFKLAPHYLDNRMIQATLNQVGESNINGKSNTEIRNKIANFFTCLLYTSPSPRDRTRSRMPSSA